MAENQVVYDASARMILHAGKPGEQIPSRFHKLTQRPDRQVAILSVFTGGNEGLELEIAAMQLLTRYLHQEVQKCMPSRYLMMKLFDQFDYSFEIESDYSLTHLKGLGDGLFANFRMRKLVMNGHELTIPLWRRNLEYWLRRILLDVIPLAVLVICYFLMPPFFKTNPVLFLGFLCVFPYLARLIGKGLWMLVMQSLVPRGYLKHLLLARKTHLSWVDRLWMRLFWGSDKRGKID